MLKVLCHSSQAGDSSSCPPALPQSPVPAPHTLPCSGGQQGGSGATCPAQGHPASRTSDSQHGGLCTALPGENGLFVLSRPSMSPQTQGRTRGPVLCVLQRGPADRQGGDSSAAPSASLSGASLAGLSWGSRAAGRAVALGGLCGTWGSHTSSGDTQGPSATVGNKATGQGCPRVLSRQQGWQGPQHGDNATGTMPWGQCHGDNPQDSSGAGQAWRTQGQCLCHCPARWGACATVWGALQAPGHLWVTKGTKPGGPLQPPGPHSLMAWDGLRPGLHPVPPPAGVCPGQGHCGPCCPCSVTQR